MRKHLLRGAAVALALLVAGRAYAFNTDVKVTGIELQKLLLGEPRSAATLAGHVVLLEFWGVNCPPCRASLPKLAKWQTDYAQQGLVIIGVHCQQATDDQVKALCQQSGVTYSIYASGRVQGGDDFNGIPHCFLFDHTGKCIFRGSPFEVEEKMKDALSQAPAAILAGRELKKLQGVSEALKAGASPGTVLKQVQTKTTSSDAATAEEARFVVERITGFGKKRIEYAKSLKDSDAYRCLAVLGEVEAGYRLTEVGDEAKALLAEYRKDKAFMDDVSAWQMLEAIRKLEGSLKPIQTASGPDTSSDRFKKSNMTTLQQMAQGFAVMKQKHPNSRATMEAEGLARKYGLLQ